MKKAGWAIGGGLALVSGVVFGSAIATSGKKAEVKPERFTILATKYDQEVGSTEAAIGLDKIRERLISKASGRVLETCAGTGRNNEFYDGTKVSELVLLDSSKDMLTEALKKPFQTTMNNNIRAVVAKDLSSLPNDTFDTVVDTFGICSVPVPAEFVSEIERVLKPGGKALFLEHGRAEAFSISGKLMNIWLDFRAAAHSDYYGCLWNREVAKAIEGSGLLVNSKAIHHYGTTTEIEATKRVK